MSEDNEQKPSDWLPSNARQPTNQKSASGNLLGYGKGEWIAAAILGIVILIGYKACARSPEGTQRTESSVSSGTSDVFGAWAYMQQFVQQSLRSPSSAKFPSGGHRDVVALGNNRYLVKSYVDSQNAFGGVVRTHFQGIIKRTDGGWELESLTFDE